MKYAYCKYCKYFDKSSNAGKNYGLCKFNPPIIVEVIVKGNPTFVERQPRVHQLDCCEEFEYGNLEKYVNNRDKIVRYMKRKNEALDGELYTSDDLDEIYEWDDETIDRVYKALGILTARNSDDVSLCPNCIKAEGCYTLDLDCENCSDCEYGSRHGICNESGSTYLFILKAAKCFGDYSVSEYIRSKGHDFHDMLEVDKYER